MPWQPAAVTYPDIEQVLCHELGPRIQAYEPDVIVAAKIPNPRPDRLVVFIRDGGNPTGLRDRPRVRCRIFDETDKAATDLARLVAGLAPRLVGTAGVLYAALLSGPLNVPDPSKHPERYLLLEFHTRPSQQLGA